MTKTETLAEARFFKTSIDLSEKQRTEMTKLLNARLADTIDLKAQTKHAHWNVKGTQFFQLHELFDQIAAHLEAHSDSIAERITALGGFAVGTVRQVAATSSLDEYDLGATSGDEHIRALAKNLAALAAKLRAGIDAAAKAGDQATSDLFTEIVRQADKDLWFVEAHLQT
ncbi:MAG: DNA starvation/stationary phase protection protein Dps [Bryobacteraceae bacterium]